MRSFHQDRLGTNIGKALKKEYRFLASGLTTDWKSPDCQYL
jgi:hypothetical protein